MRPTGGGRAAPASAPGNAARSESSIVRISPKKIPGSEAAAGAIPLAGLRLPRLKGGTGPRPKRRFFSSALIPAGPTWVSMWPASYYAAASGSAATASRMFLRQAGSERGFLVPAASKSAALAQSLHETVSGQVPPLVAHRAGAGGPGPRVPGAPRGTSTWLWGPAMISMLKGRGEIIMFWGCGLKGAGCRVPGAGCRGPGRGVVVRRYPAPGTRPPAPGPLHRAPGTRHPAPGTRRTPTAKHLSFALPFARR